VPVPRSVLVCGGECAPAHGLEFPLVVKPRQSRVRMPAGWLSTSVSYARDAEELRRDLQGRGAHEFPVMLQECIEGPGVGVFACYHRGRPAALFSHRRIRERPPWGGVSVLSESTALDPMAQDYAVKLLDEIKWHGVAMVEFKRDRRDGVPKLMEINGRFWGSLQLAIDAGVDFPGLLVEGVQAETMPPPQPYRLGVRNRWFWGDADSLLLTLVGGHVAPKGQPGRARTIANFLKLWGKDLYYENPKLGDLRPWLLETRRWIGKGLGEGRRTGAPVANPPASDHGVAAPGSAPARVSSDAGGLKATIEMTDEGCLRAGQEGAWNALLPTSDTNSVFQTHAWNRSWFEAFREHFEPCIVTVSDGHGIAGIAPLVIARNGSRDRVIRFLGDGRSDYCDFLTGPNKEEAMRAMFAAVFSGVDWDVMELHNVPAGSRTTAMAQAICSQAGYKVLVADQFLCPTLMIAGHEDSARAILNKPSLRRPTNYFQRAGRLVCRDLTGAEEIEPYLDQFFEQHVGRWNGTRSPSLFVNGRNRAFYRVLTRNLSGSGALLFSVIELDGRPIAFHYGFDYNRSVIWYKPSFDITHAAHSPGLVLMRHLIDYAVGHDRRELDFTVGDEPFKRRFTNLTRKTVSLLVFRDASRYLLEATRRKVVSAVSRVSRTTEPQRMKVTQ
jgi:CelD/BcsL family acetyltransferase involved in cellulose biosynthesis